MAVLPKSYLYKLCLPFKKDGKPFYPYFVRTEIEGGVCSDKKFMVRARLEPRAFSMTQL